MVTATGLAYHIDRLTKGVPTLALRAIALMLIVVTCVAIIVSLLPEAPEPVVMGPLRWFQ